MTDPLLISLKNSVCKAMPSRLLVGLSGGLDSTALLHAVTELKNSDYEFKHIPIIAIHVHHGLSDDADHWLMHCEKQCKELGVKYISEKVSLDLKKGSLEKIARDARYRVFEKIMKDNDVLLLAHHQDDQVETFMMRLMRGSGLTGLSAMDAVRTFESGSIIRPWLTHTRSELEQYVANHQLSFIEDESNQNTRFDRNWWRHDLLPSLRKRYPQSSDSIVKTIDVLQQERQVLLDLITPIFEQSVDFDSRFTQSLRLNCQSLLTQTQGVQVQLVRMWLQQQDIYPSLNGEQIQQVVKDVVKAKQDAEPIYLWGEHTIRRYNDHLYAVKAGPLKAEIVYSHSVSFEDVSESMFLGEPFSGQLTASNSVENGLLPGKYELKSYEASMKAKPYNRATKPLKKWFKELDVPPWLRSMWPVIMKEGQVVCVPNLFVCEGFTSETGLDIGFTFISKPVKQS